MCILGLRTEYSVPYLAELIKKSALFQVSISEWMDKHNMVHTYNEILSSL